MTARRLQHFQNESDPPLHPHNVELLPIPSDPNKAPALPESVLSMKRQTGLIEGRDSICYANLLPMDAPNEAV